MYVTVVYRKDWGIRPRERNIKGSLYNFISLITEAMAVCTLPLRDCSPGCQGYKQLRKQQKCQHEFYSEG